MLHRNLVTEQAGDVSFVGVGHVGIRALADFRQLYPLSRNEALVSRAFLAGFATKRVRRGHERRSPLARELVSRDLCHRRPPGRQRRGDLAQHGSHHVANCSRCFGIGAA